MNPVTKFKMKQRTLFAVLVAIASVAFVGCSSPVQDEPDDTVEQPDDPSPSPDHFEDLGPIDPHERSMSADEGWFRDEVFYHVWVNAFYNPDSEIDHSNEVYGQISGITEKLEYLDKTLGVTALWLSPFFESDAEGDFSENLHQYDTADHYNVDPRFGDNEEVYELIEEAHDRDMRLIFDWVPNHVSSDHQWFVDSANRESGRDNWFVWEDDAPSGGHPLSDGWHEAPAGSVRSGEYYLGGFWDGMPDINFRNQGAKDAITKTAIHWLNAGFDGMRVDAVRYLYAAEDYSSYVEQPETFEYFNAVREQVLDAYGDQGYYKFMTAEAWTGYNTMLRYMDEGGFHQTLDFTFPYAAADREVSGLSSHFDRIGDFSDDRDLGTFLSNHDNVVNRPKSVHELENGDGNLMRSVVAVQLMGPGTPYIYYGNEIGMEDADEYDGGPHADRRHRQPFEWDEAEAQEGDPESLLTLHSELISLRQDRESLRHGDFTAVSDHSDLFAFVRSYVGEHTFVVSNLGESDQEVYFELADAGCEDDVELLWADALAGSDAPDVSINGETVTIEGSLSAGASVVFEVDSATIEDSKATEFAKDPYDAGEIEFRYYGEVEDEVRLSGDMNEWADSDDGPENEWVMNETEDDVHALTISLDPGSYEYKYIIDGEWVEPGSIPDAVIPLPNAETDDGFGGTNAVIEVE